MLMPSIFGEDLFDDWMRSPAVHENNRGYRSAELMKTDIKDVDGNYELSMDLPGFHKEDVKIQLKEVILPFRHPELRRKMRRVTMVNTSTENVTVDSAPEPSM